MFCELDVFISLTEFICIFENDQWVDKGNGTLSLYTDPNALHEIRLEIEPDLKP